MKLCEQCVNKICRCRGCVGHKWITCPPDCFLKERETCLGFEKKKESTITIKLEDKSVYDGSVDEIKRRLNLLNELMQCWSSGCLSDIAAITAASIIMNNQELSEEARKWAIKAFTKSEDKCHYQR